MPFALIACSPDQEVSAVACQGSAETIARIEPLLKGDVAALQAVDDPKPVPQLTFTKADGTSGSLADFRGKTILVNIWATWCAPCRHEMPAFDALQAEMGGNLFEIVPISVDRGDDQKPKAFYEEIGLKNLGFYHDPTMDAFNTLKKDSLAFGLPVTLLVDEKGCLLAAMNGPAEWAGEDAKSLVAAAIGRDS